MQTTHKKPQHEGDPKVLKDYLQQPSLEGLVQRVQHITSIKKILQNCLPATFLANCQILNIENGVLTLAANSAALVTRLRYLTPELMTALNSTKAISPIHHIAFRVIPPRPTINTTEKPSPVLSTKTLHLLEETAKNINHPQLKKSLQNLAK